MTSPLLKVGLLCVLAATAHAGNQPAGSKTAAAAQEPVSFIMDDSMRKPDGSWVNANAAGFMRRHDASGGISVRLAAGDDGIESTCARRDEAWTCRIGRQSAMSDGLYRYILAQVAPSHEAESVPDKKPSLSNPDKQGLYAGYRGLTLPVSGHQLAFLKKGDHVDVMVTFDAKMKNDIKEKVTATILQNVIIVDLLKPAKLEEPGAVQLLLNPNEAQYAALSLVQGDIHIAARSQGDVEMHAMEMASFRKLFR